MDKNYFSVIMIFFFFVAKAQIVNIPDPNFKSRLLMASESNFIAFTGSFNFSGGNTIDTNHNGEIEVAEALLIQTLYVGEGGISNLTGIEAFVNLRSLTCDHNNLTQLNISSLTDLNELYASNNQLTTINMTGADVVTLSISYNNFTNVDFLESEHLSFFYCGYNQITELDLSEFEWLYRLNCSHNQLTNLILPQQSEFNELQELDCSYNELTNLTYYSAFRFDCSHNQLTHIDVTPSGSMNLEDMMGYVNCSFNPLVSITELVPFTSSPPLNFSNIPALQHICCLPVSYSAFESMAANYGYTNCVVDNACTLSVDEHNKTTDITIYPNPVHGIIQFEQKLDVPISAVEIYNVVGQLVLKPSANLQSKTIDVSKLSSGNYILKIHSDKGISNTKFIKQ